MNYIDIIVSNPNNLVIDIYKKVSSTVYTPLPIKYRYYVDTTIQEQTNFVYKIETYGDYYYAITTMVSSLTQKYADLFYEIPKCSLILAHSFSLTCGLLGGGDTSTYTKQFFKQSDNSKIIFIKAPSSDVYTNTNINYDHYIYSITSYGDELPFYSQIFSVTSFDQTRSVYNLAKRPFIMDLTDVICDLSSMQFYIKDTSSLNFPLTCSYESTNNLQM